jgi:hypothetical protein
MAIHELLHTGIENATTARDLADYFGCTAREITRAIECERRQGFPICATCGRVPGYYLAKDAEELRDYCKRLYRRGGEIFKTRRALIDILRKWDGNEVKAEEINTGKGILLSYRSIEGQ